MTAWQVMLPGRFFSKGAGMKKGLKALIIALAMLVCFILGWRVMPRVWPAIRDNVVYAVFPSLKPDQEAERLFYEPHSDTAFGDPIAQSDSLIYYFYKDYCPYCAELEPLTAGLPKRVTLPDGTHSAVRLVCLNKVEEQYAAIIEAYYDAHEVPDERRYVPAIVIGDKYLYLGDEIIGQLMDSLTAGEGLSTPVLGGGARVD